MTSNSATPKGPIFGLFGAGGCGRDVMPFALEFLSQEWGVDAERESRVYFIETAPLNAKANGIPLISDRKFFDMACEERLFNVAINDSHAREHIAKSFEARGARPFSLFSPDSKIYPGNEIGKGAIISAQAILTVNVKVGVYFHANIFSYVAHDCVIGNYVTFAPRASCNGNVHIHDHVYIGAGALIRQGSSRKPLVIGEGAVVGMGAVVIGDVAPHSTVAGNPARPIRSRDGQEAELSHPMHSAETDRR